MNSITLFIFKLCEELNINCNLVAASVLPMHVSGYLLSYENIRIKLRLDLENNKLKYITIFDTNIYLEFKTFDDIVNILEDYFNILIPTDIIVKTKIEVI